MEFENPWFLASDRLYYRKVTEEHCNSNYLGWLNDPEINYYLESGKYPETISSIKEFVNNVYSKEVLFLAIHKIKDDKHIGNIKIDSINRIHSIAEYGILIGDKTEWGNGYAKEASEIILRHAFNILNIRKITLGVIAGNDGAIKLYETLGFSVEGVYKKHVYCNGKYRDIIRMAIFQNDFR